MKKKESLRKSLIENTKDLFIELKQDNKNQLLSQTFGIKGNERKRFIEWEFMWVKFIIELLSKENNMLEY